MKSGARPYHMTARAQSAARTAERILDATVDLFWESPTDRFSLDEVARRAGVSVQTVIRRFGSKDDLLAAATERETARIVLHRDQAPADDLRGAVKVLVDHYEDLGDRVLRMLDEERRIPAVRVITDQGRALHRAWCSRVFAAALDRRAGADRDRLLAQLVAVCDLQTWKLLRRDAGLPRRETELALCELLEPVLEGPR